MGAAIHASQSFEYSVGFLLALIAEHREPTAGEVLSASLDLRATQTLGKLVQEVKRELPDLPEEIGEYLKEGLELRNRLVHGFFPRNTERLMKPKGRIELQDELTVTVLEIQSRDKVVWQLIGKFLIRYGIATDQLAKQVDNTWRAYQFQLDDDHPSGKH